ncbi:MAG TPA: hydrolase [Bacteroidia bacterium]|nr:hydrolase [Bacteroidia bacterium]
MDAQKTSTSKIIAVDFDGTIVEHAYPKIGKEMLFAFATLKALQAKGHKLILWTIRTGHLLDEAVEFCRQNGVEFYAVNKNFPDEEWSPDTPRKLNVDIFIDDRNLGGFPGWSKVWQMLHPEGGDFQHILTDPEAHYNYKKPSFFKRLFGKK